jgi:hypothetical protein
MYGWRSCVSILFVVLHIAQVGKEVHGSTTDAASNMRSAFESFEGASCVDHKIQNALKTASKSAFIEKLEKACRGIVNHFRRSQKVCMCTRLCHHLRICTKLLLLFHPCRLLIISVLYAKTLHGQTPAPLLDGEV